MNKVYSVVAWDYPKRVGDFIFLSESEPGEWNSLSEAIEGTNGWLSDKLALTHDEELYEVRKNYDKSLISIYLYETYDSEAANEFNMDGEEVIYEQD